MSESYTIVVDMVHYQIIGLDGMGSDAYAGYDTRGCACRTSYKQ